MIPLSLIFPCGMSGENTSRRPKSRVGLLLVVTVLAAFPPGCAVHREPANLYLHKQEIRAYMESGAYMQEIERVAKQAQRWIEDRAVRGGTKLTVVFDLDETLFFNWPHTSAMDFGYVSSAWDQWVEEAKAPAIEPVREVYLAARRLGIDVVLITGRPERQRASTERNLRAIGCGDYAELVCRGTGGPKTTAAFKAAERQRLVEQGRIIIANIGDQEGDLSGGNAERAFKLPNVIYITE